MSDGTTAIQVSPTEEEQKMAGLLRRAADAIVSLSSMTAEIDNLREGVNRLKADLEQKTWHVENLERTIHELREQRDQANAKAYEAEQQRDLAFDQKAQAEDQANARQRELEDVLVERDQARHDRDEHGLKVLELEDKLREANDRVQKVRELFGVETEQPTAKVVNW